MSPRTGNRQVATCIFCLIVGSMGGAATAAATDAATPTAPAATAPAPTVQGSAAAPAIGQAAQAPAAAAPVKQAPTAAASTAAAPTTAAPVAQAPTAAPTVQLAPDVAAQLAHSALLTVEGTATANALQLRIRRASDQSVVSSDDVTVTVDGKNEPVTREDGGIYSLAVEELRGDVGKDVEIIVGHDGIREILTAKVSAAQQATSAEGLLRDHKQVAWWILNIVIVLIAAIAISRRKG